MTPAQNSAIKVGINFGAVVLAVWVADLSMTAFKNYQATRKAGGAPASAPAGNGGGAPPQTGGQ